jgi:hypothetical protein
MFSKRHKVTRNSRKYFAGPKHRTITTLNIVFSIIKKTSICELEYAKVEVVISVHAMKACVQMTV